MKTYSKWLTALTVVAVLLGSCKKEENKDYYAGGSAPVLSASDTAITLDATNASANAVTLNWTNPQYRFTSGISSLNVNYAIEIDTLGANFTSPKKFTVTVASDLSKTFTITELNSDLSNAMGLSQDTPHTIQMRIVSSLGGSGSVALASNPLQYKVTPYSPPPLVALPVTGELYLVGDATAGGWANPVPVPSQQFTKESKTMYDITVSLTGGKEYLLLPKNGDWGQKYAVKDNTVSGLSSGGSFGFYTSGGANFPGPSASGNYKITVDFQKGIFTVTKL